MKQLAFILTLTLLLSAFAGAQEYRSISAKDLKKQMDSKTKVLVVDARTAQEYNQGHIPHAINITPEQLHLIGTLLPKDKNVPVVFYCRGVG